MKKLIKIYGERNTNTNYISKLIQLNLNVQEVPGVAPPHIQHLQEMLPGKELVKDLYFYLTVTIQLIIEKVLDKVFP